MKNLDLLFKMHTGMDVRVASPTTYVMPDSATLIEGPRYATLVGIILDAIRMGRYTEVEERPQGAVGAMAGAAVAEGGSAEYADTYQEQVRPAGGGYSSLQQQGGTPDDGYGGYYEGAGYGQGGNNGGYVEEEYVEEELRVRKPKMSERMKRLFSSMFAEEVDDDDDNY